MTCGIYRIFNLVTEKSYVGSSIDIDRRFYGSGGHLGLLETASHYNQKLQNSWNLHGKDKFKLETLQICAEDRLTYLEAFWIARLNSLEDGYNIAILTLEDDLVVRRHSKETRQKISEANSGKPKALETRRKLSIAKCGFRHSIESKQSISRALKGRVFTKLHRQKLVESFTPERLKRMSEIAKNPSLEARQKMGHAKGKEFSEEHRNKISQSQFGKVQSEETKRKISESKTGKALAEAHIQAIAIANTGKKHTEDTRKRMSEARKAFWATKRASNG